MTFLLWKFDWASMLATTTATHGAYAVRGDDTQKNRWTARFRRSKAGEGTDVIYKDQGAIIQDYDSMAEAIHACQQHCNEFRPDASNRFEVVANIPR